MLYHVFPHVWGAIPPGSKDVKPPRWGLSPFPPYMLRFMDASSEGVVRMDGRGRAFPWGMTQPNGDDDIEDVDVEEEEEDVVG